jgi:hypothetical protein
LALFDLLGHFAEKDLKGPCSTTELRPCYRTGRPAIYGLIILHESAAPERSSLVRDLRANGVKVRRAALIYCEVQVLISGGLAAVTSFVGGPIREKRAREALIVVEGDRLALPLPLESHRRAVIGDESARKRGPIVHSDRHILSIGVMTDALGHFGVGAHAQFFTARRTQISPARKIWIPVAVRPGPLWLELNIDRIVAVLRRVNARDAAPIGNRMEMSAEIVRPRRKHRDHRQVPEPD